MRVLGSNPAPLKEQDVLTSELTLAQCHILLTTSTSLPLGEASHLLFSVLLQLLLSPPRTPTESNLLCCFGFPHHPFFLVVTGILDCQLNCNCNQKGAFLDGLWGQFQEGLTVRRKSSPPSRQRLPGYKEVPGDSSAAYLPTFTSHGRAHLSHCCSCHPLMPTVPSFFCFLMRTEDL